MPSHGAVVGACDFDKSVGSLRGCRPFSHQPLLGTVFSDDS